MTDAKYSTQEGPFVGGDYVNELFGMQGSVDVSLGDRGFRQEEGEDVRFFYARVPHATFHQAMKEAQRECFVRTLEGRFLDHSPHNMQRLRCIVARRRLVRWMLKNTEHVCRLDALAHEINTTDDVKSFQSAVNDMYALMGRNFAPFPVHHGEQTNHPAHPVRVEQEGVGDCLLLDIA